MELVHTKNSHNSQSNFIESKIYNSLYLYAISIIVYTEIEAERVYKKLIEYATDTFPTTEEAKLMDIIIKVMDAITKEGYEENNCIYADYPLCKLYKTVITFDSYGNIIPIYQTTLKDKVIDGIKLKVKETNTDTN